MSGVQFDISIEANGIGVDATADSLNALAERINLTNKVATEFDRAVAAVRSRLDEATSVTKAASAALQVAEARYKELESAANKAAKALELAKIDGEPLAEYEAAANAANAKMREQAKLADELRSKSDAAAAAQSKLAGTLKTLEQQQSAASARVKQREAADAKIREQSYAAMATADQKRGAEAAQSLAKRAAMLKIAAAAGAVFAIATLGSVAALGRFAVMSSPAAMQRLTAASMRLTLGMKGLVSGLKLDKFVGGLEDIGTLFDKGNSSANGMKAIVETIMQPLLDGAAKAAPYVKEMFKGLIYGALQVVIAVLTIRNAIFKAMSPETRNAIKSVVDQVFTIENAFKLGTAAAVVITATAIVLTAALVGLAVAELAALWPILLIVAAVAAVIAILMNWGAITDWLVEMWDGFVAFVKRIPGAWVDAAKAMIDGLVKGIKDGAAAVWKAMSDLAGGAIDAFKNKLGIKSPSVVMRATMQHVTEGAVLGAEDGIDDVESAGASMADAVVDGASSGGKPVAGSSSSTDARKVVNFYGPVSIGSDRGAWSEFATFLGQALDGAEIVYGGSAAPQGSTS